MRKIIASLALLVAMASAALAQSSPGFYYGFVPSAAQWNSYFAAKQDVLGYTPLNQAGGVMTGHLGTTAATASSSGFTLAPGVAPTTPNNGDLWMTTAGLFARVNGVTIGPLAAGTTSSFAATAPVTVGASAGVVTYGLSYDANFANVAGSLGFASIASGNMLANCGAASAEPTTCAPSTWLDHWTAAAANDLVLYRTGGAWGTVAMFGGAHTWTGAQTFNDGNFKLAGATSGTLTVHAPAIAGTSSITWPAGTVDFSATGGVSQVVKQTSAGAPFTVAQLGFSDVSGTASLSQGGTGQTSALGGRGAAGLNIDQATLHGDSDYTILATDRTVQTNTTLTAPRTWTMPTVASVNAGQKTYILDAAGGVTSTNTITIVRSGSDTINGGTSVVLNATYGGYTCSPDGLGKWTCTAGGSQSVANSVQIGTIPQQYGNLTPYEGLTLKTTSTTAATLSASALTVFDSSNTPKRLTSWSIALSTAVSGAGGIDTGSVANAWYYVWAIAKADGTKSAVMSLSATSPTMPSGYTFKGIVGALRVDVSLNLVGQYQYNNVAQTTRQTVLNSGASTTIAAVSLGGFIPTSIANSVAIDIQINTSTGGPNNLACQVGVAGVTSTWTYGYTEVQGAVDATGVTQAKVVGFDVTNAQIEYLVSGTNARCTIWVNGWRY